MHYCFLRRCSQCILILDMAGKWYPSYAFGTIFSGQAFLYKYFYLLRPTAREGKGETSKNCCAGVYKTESIAMSSKAK